MCGQPRFDSSHRFPDAELVLGVQIFVTKVFFDRAAEVVLVTHSLQSLPDVVLRATHSRRPGSGEASFAHTITIYCSRLNL